MGVVPSIEMVIWVAVGGRGTLIGAVLGALLVGYTRSWLSESYPSVWQFFQGLLFVGSVMLFPDGLLGATRSLLRWFAKLRGANNEKSGRTIAGEPHPIASPAEGVH